MLDRQALLLLRQPLQQAAYFLQRRGICADQVTIAGFAIGLLVIPALALHWYQAALGCILLNRLADGIDGPLARLTAATDSGAFLDIVLDFLFYAAVVLGFALSDPARNGLAAAFLLFTFIGTGSSFLAFSIMAERFQMINLRLPQKGFYYLGGLTEGTETILFFFFSCLWPALFPLLALLFGCCCLVTTCTRVLYGYRVLKKGRDIAT